MISWGSASEDDTGIFVRPRARRSEASAARTAGVAFFSYHGRGIQFLAVPNVGMYQVQIAEESQSEVSQTKLRARSAVQPSDQLESLR